MQKPGAQTDQSQVTSAGNPMPPAQQPPAQSKPLGQSPNLPHTSWQNWVTRMQQGTPAQQQPPQQAKPIFKPENPYTPNNGNPGGAHNMPQFNFRDFNWAPWFLGGGRFPGQGGGQRPGPDGYKGPDRVQPDQYNQGGGAPDYGVDPGFDEYRSGIIRDMRYRTEEEAARERQQDWERYQQRQQRGGGMSFGEDFRRGDQFLGGFNDFFSGRRGGFMPQFNNGNPYYFGGQSMSPGVGRYRPPTMENGNWNDMGGYNYNLPNAFGSYPGYGQGNPYSQFYGMDYGSMYGFMPQFRGDQRWAPPMSRGRWG